MAFISEETILEVKRACDIFEVVSSYFPLKRGGADYKALCPFHDEKTPSFYVSVRKQIFKCFGCGKGGNVIDFVMAHEKLEFQEAVKKLAERAGIQIRYVGEAAPELSKDALYKVNQWAAELYHKILKNAPANHPAKTYLASRGITEQTIDAFKLGYAPDSWDEALKSGRRVGYSQQLLVDSGLVTQRPEDGRVYDRFRHRVMIPILDAAGRVIAFGGRSLDKDQEPKYLNSSESAIFSKGRNFFGLNLVKQELDRLEEVYIVEGYFDVILPYQFGVRGLLATLGTALTKDHVSLLRRYVQKVTLVFDPDEAGERASKRGLDMLIGEDLDIGVCRMPEGLDPDDFVTKHGRDALVRELQQAQDVFDFMVDTLSKEHDPRTDSGKTRLIEGILGYVARVENEIKRNILLQRVSGRFGIEERALKTRMKESRTRAMGVPAPKKALLTPEERLGREMVALMLQDPQSLLALKEAVGAQGFPTETTRTLAAKIFEIHEKFEHMSASDLMAFFPEKDPAREALMEIADTERAIPDPKKALSQCLQALEAFREDRVVEELKAQLKDPSVQDKDGVLAKLQALLAKRRK